MRALLVNPWIYDFAAYDLWARPLGLLYLAAMLEAAGWEVRLVDCLDRAHPDSEAPPPRASQPPGTGPWKRTPVDTPAVLSEIPRRYCRYGLPEEAFRRMVRNGPPPDQVLITSSMTYWYPGVRRAVEIVREEWPGAEVVIGGTYATLCTDHARTLGADRVVSGPGEAFVKEQTGRDPGVWTDFRPALHLYPRLWSIPLMTSRGCPYHCPYCASKTLQPGFSQRSPQSILDEIDDHLRQYDARDIAFFDDALLIDAPNRILPVFEAMAGKMPGLRMHAPNGLHVGRIDYETARLMRAAGFQTIRLGVESLEPERSEAMGGKTSLEEFQLAMENLTRAGFDPGSVGAYILYGLPGQDLDEVMTTARAVGQTGARPYLAEYSPLPGTALWEEALKVSPFDLAAEPLYHNNTFFPCRPVGFSWQAAWEVKRRALEV